MSMSASSRTEAKTPRTSGGESAGKAALPPIRWIGIGCAVVALVVALGMTGGQVRQLATRVTAMEGEREAFERRVDKLRSDNKELVNRLRDYQTQIEVVQSANTAMSKGLAESQAQMGVVQASNVSLSKRLANREMAVEDLQDSLDSILTAKYETENALRAEIAKLENLKRDLSAQVAALGEAVAAQSQEIAQMDMEYQVAQRRIADAGERNDVLLAENDRYLTLLNEMQDDLDAVQEEGEIMSERFTALEAQTAAVEAEKLAIQQELETIRSAPALPLGVEAQTADPFEGRDPFGFDFPAPVEAPAEDYDDRDGVVGVFEERST